MDRKRTVAVGQKGDALCIEYDRRRDGSAVSRTYRDGKLVFEVVLSKFGAPQSGKMFGDHRKVLKKFTYGLDGQVSSVGGKSICKR